MAANGTYSRGMLVIRRLIHKLVLRRNLANNIGGRGGGQNRPCVLGTLNYGGDKLERGKIWFGTFLNIHRYIRVYPVQINNKPDATIFQFIILTFIYKLNMFQAFPRSSSGAQ
jgi:hypothetical protein